MHPNIPTVARVVFALCPSALGTYCSPTALSMAFSDTDVFYHAYAAGQKLTREDLWVSLSIPGRVVAHELFYRTPPKGDPDASVLLHAADIVVCSGPPRPS